MERDFAGLRNGKYRVLVSPTKGFKSTQLLVTRFAYLFAVLLVIFNLYQLK